MSTEISREYIYCGIFIAQNVAFRLDFQPGIKNELLNMNLLPIRLLFALKASMHRVFDSQLLTRFSTFCLNSM